MGAFKRLSRHVFVGGGPWRKKSNNCSSIGGSLPQQSNFEFYDLLVIWLRCSLVDTFWLCFLLFLVIFLRFPSFFGSFRNLIANIQYYSRLFGFQTHIPVKVRRFSRILRLWYCHFYYKLMWRWTNYENDWKASLNCFVFTRMVLS